MRERRKYKKTCRQCGVEHEQEVTIKISREARISDDLSVTCCGQALPLEVVSRKILRRFDRLRRFFAPESFGGGQRPMPLDEVKAFARGEQPWVDCP